jgi:hypothetical protein
MPPPTVMTDAIHMFSGRTGAVRNRFDRIGRFDMYMLGRVRRKRSCIHARLMKPLARTGEAASPILHIWDVTNSRSASRKFPLGAASTIEARSSEVCGPLSVGGLRHDA